MTDLVESSANGITSDNIHLSKLIQPSHETTSVEASDRRLPFNCTDPKVLEFLAAATAPNTRRAYESDVRHFIARGGRIPATSEQVARYLADRAGSLSVATLARRLAGIRAAHVERGFPDPTKGEPADRTVAEAYRVEAGTFRKWKSNKRLGKTTDPLMKSFREKTATIVWDEPQVLERLKRAGRDFRAEKKLAFINKK
jgi:hypothetical protein